MMENWSLALQLTFLLSYLPLTYLAYRALREKRKHERAEWELVQIADKDTDEFKEALGSARYGTKDFLIPLLYVTVVLAVLYTMTHPRLIETGLWSGLLERNVLLERFALGGFLTPELAVGRLLFWCWLGAYVYSLERTVRHYLADDLSPRVYISATKRFIVAFVVGAVLSLAVAAGGDAVNLQNDSYLAFLYVVCFVAGVFPERAMRAVVANSARVLGRNQEEDEQKNLSAIDGVTYWHRGRLEDEGVETVQNLATAHLLRLVVKTPYDVSQVVDWVDQAILLTYTTEDQAERLMAVGLQRASQVLAAAQIRPQELADATGLPVTTIHFLGMTLAVAANMKPICQYRGLISATRERPVEVEIAAPINLPVQVEPAAAEMLPLGVATEAANGAAAGTFSGR
jgi:hypothetical protein